MRIFPVQMMPADILYARRHSHVPCCSTRVFRSYAVSIPLRGSRQTSANPVFTSPSGTRSQGFSLFLGNPGPACMQRGAYLYRLSSVVRTETPQFAALCAPLSGGVH